MVIPRIIPILLLRDRVLVKGKRFKKHRYIGDPINAIRIFNDFQVDELIVIDISAQKRGTPISVEQVKTFSGECFMPLAVGGGIRDVEYARELLRAGAEKVIVNSAFIENPEIVTQLSHEFGSQSVVVSIDYQEVGLFKKSYRVITECGTSRTSMSPQEAALLAESSGAGEVMMTNIDLEGSYQGYDLRTLEELGEHLSIPIIVNGGAGTPQHLVEGISSGASGSAAGSMFVFHGTREAVLISHPERTHLDSLLDVI